MAQSSGKAGSLFYGMSLDTTEFKKRLKEARKFTSSVGKQIREGFTTIAKGAAVVGGAMAAGSAAMLAFAKSTAEATNAQLLLADSIGATQAEVAGLEVAAEKFGVETSMLIDKVREFGGVDAFKKYADQVKNAGDEQAQINKAVEIFGGEGAKMVSILKQGAEGLAAMEQEAISLGLALSPTQIAQTNTAWKQFEDTVLRIQGLTKQLGTALMEPFGLASAAVGGFISTFKDDMIAGFTLVSDFMTESIKAGINTFINFGIPAINTFIQFANQIGDAFATIFNFIGGSDPFKSIVGGIESIAETLGVFLSNFQQIFISGITGAINDVIRFAFNSLAKFSDFIGEQLTTIAFAVGQDDFAQGISDAFTEQAAGMRQMGEDLAEPFKIAMEDADRQMTKDIERQADKNLRNQLQFRKFILNFQEDFESTVEESQRQREDAVAAALKASEERAGMAVTGSQEEFRARTMQQDMMVDISSRNLKANEITAKAAANTGIF